MTLSNTKQDLINYVVRLGDDSVVLGHRVSEWISNAPFLEEDIALGNVSLDFIGHARMYYTYAADLTNATNPKASAKTEDDFAYLRTNWNSTRRFNLRPAVVLLVAIGRASPYPAEDINELLTP